MFKITFSRKYHLGHRLLRSGLPKCRVPHGHTSTVMLTLSVLPSFQLEHPDNAVAPFHLLKSKWHKWIDEFVDQSLQLSSDDPLLRYFCVHEPEIKPHILVLPGDPTTECLAVAMKAKAETFLQATNLPVTVEAVEIRETDTNSIVFAGRAREQLQGGATKPWWARDDFSINDLP